MPSNDGPFLQISQQQQQQQFTWKNWLIHFIISFNVIFVFAFLFSVSFHFLRVYAALPEDPEFTDVIENITVPAGRNIKLACSVKNLGSYKVFIRNKQLTNNTEQTESDHKT